MNKRCNKGMTMIEILVAFVMLTLVMVILYSSIKFASNLLREATDVDRKNSYFERAVAEKFKDEDGYKLGSGDEITYTFKVKGESGEVVDEFDYKLYTANVSFKRNDDEYVVTNDDTDDNVRKLYLFSTGD